ncbi:hypothetical protein [Mesorhizobium sp. WSM3224]|uniref:hypothetical protein n=1 Tax=Mesorhizobium sp. WSM3224 TaxID=1040986 RepID=UPI000485E813|nr:hypothetical protein [Mesorhizobium sp. WSM3224]
MVDERQKAELLGTPVRHGEDADDLDAPVDLAGLVKLGLVLLWESQVGRHVGLGAQEFCARGRFMIGSTNLSPNRTANWVLASNRSRGSCFHSSAA